MFRKARFAGASVERCLRVLLVVGLGACLFLMPRLAHGQGPAKAALPKVRVAADGRTFATSEGKPFVPIGVNYYRPGTGWAPQVWKQFDPEATSQDFARMKQLGINCVRVFLTYGSFYTDAGQLRADGLAQFDQFLKLAEDASIYVHPTGPDHWEGMPNWRPVQIGDESSLAALESADAAGKAQLRQAGERLLPGGRQQQGGESHPVRDGRLFCRVGRRHHARLPLPASRSGALPANPAHP